MENNFTSADQGLFNEIGTHAKSAMEKGARAFEDMNDFGKGNVEALVESGKIAAKGLETMGHDAAAFGRQQFEGATVALKSFAAVKSPTEFFQLQGDFMRQAIDGMVVQTSKNAEVMLKLAGEVAHPISSRVAVAVERSKLTA